MEDTEKTDTGAQKPLQDSNAIMNAFRQKFATTVHSVMVNSLGREVPFRDVTTNEQKTLSKVSLENERRKDIVYDTQCQLINQLCLEEGFSVYRLTEFDRIRLLMEVYQANYFRGDVTYKCEKCGTENVYKLDFQQVIDRFDKFDLTDKVFTTEDQSYVYKFTVNYPLVRRVSDFYKDYMKRYRGISDTERDVLDSLGNIDYVNLFIKGVELISKADNNDRISADLTLMTCQEVERFIDEFPQGIVFSEKGGVVNFITENFVERLNGVFRYERCRNCGAETDQGIGSLVDFF